MSSSSTPTTAVLAMPYNFSVDDRAFGIEAKAHGRVLSV